MPAMTLLQAFQEYGPTDEQDPFRERREAAGELLGQELARQARSMTFRRDLLDEAIQEVLIYLLPAGPRGERPQDPPTDKRVSYFLRWLLHRRAISLQRGEKPYVELGPEEIPGPETWEDPVDSARASKALAEAKEELRSQIVPRIAREKQPSAAAEFLESVQQMMEMSEGRLDFESVVQAEVEQGKQRGTVVTGAHAVQRARMRLHQRYKRALRHIADEIDAMCEAGLRPMREHALRQQAGALSLRGQKS